jgi:phosphoglycerate dehydrogenase-like enzyme
MSRGFLIGLTADFHDQGLSFVETYVKQMLSGQQDIAYTWLPSMRTGAIAREIDRCDAIVSLAIPYTAESFAGLERLALIARWGVGYDMVDVPACTAAGVALAITPNGIRPPVVEGAITLVLALLKRLPEKDRAVRAGLWRGDLPEFGHNTSGVVLGSVGLGNIGAAFMRLAGAFSFPRLLAYDPFASPDKAEQLKVELVDLDTLLRESDVVSLHCPLGKSTYHLIGERELGLMKPTAYLVNTARGAVVDQKALTRVLQERRIAGAGLDVLEQEPPDATDPLLHLDNVILTPHAIAWTHEEMREVTEEDCQACIGLAHGRLPQALVNREVADNPLFRSKLERIRAAL